MNGVGRLRVGVISTARIGTGKVIPGMQQSQRCEVVAIGSRDLAPARAVADRLGIARAHGSYDAVLADPDVDAVYIPLPNHLHAEWTMKAADAGKHVLCEKPFTVDAAEADAVGRHCAAAGVQVMEAFMYRWHPSWIEVKRLVDSGAIGTLQTVQAWFSYFNDDPANIRNVPEYGGGMLYDIGCYPINVARWLFGAEPDVVGADVRRSEHGVDVLTSAMLSFGDAGTATFTVSSRTAADQRVHIYGTRGRISVDIPFNIPPHLPVMIRLTRGGPPEAPDTEVVEFPAVDQYGLMADAFAEAVLAGNPPPYGADDAAANMRVIDAIFAAAT